jgi:hypothetical protein
MKNGCWEWTGAKTEKGYGQFYYTKQNGTRTNGRAHRFSYLHFIGSYNPKMIIHHKCRNTSCVNPEHLEVRTNRSNVLEGSGPTSINARKTKCCLGHPLDAVNTYYRKRMKKDGTYTVERNCIKCKRRKRQEWLIKYGQTKRHS